MYLIETNKKLLNINDYYQLIYMQLIYLIVYTTKTSRFNKLFSSNPSSSAVVLTKKRKKFGYTRFSSEIPKNQIAYEYV